MQKTKIFKSGLLFLLIIFNLPVEKIMVSRLAFSCVCVINFFCTTIFAQQPKDFLGFSWGTTKAEVKESVELRLKPQFGQLYHEDDRTFLIRGNMEKTGECLLMFIFENQRLIGGRLINLNYYSDKNQYITEFIWMKEEYTKGRLGMPKTDNQTWKSSQYKGNMEKRGYAISIGDLSYNTKWETDKSLVELSLYGHDGFCVVEIDFTSKISSKNPTTKQTSQIFINPIDFLAEEFRAKQSTFSNCTENAHEFINQLQFRNATYAIIRCLELGNAEAHFELARLLLFMHKWSRGVFMKSIEKQPPTVSEKATLQREDPFLVIIREDGHYRAEYAPPLLARGLWEQFNVLFDQSDYLRLITFELESYLSSKSPNTQRIITAKEWLKVLRPIAGNTPYNPSPLSTNDLVARMKSGNELLKAIEQGKLLIQ